MKMIIYAFTKSYATSLGIELIPMGIEAIEVSSKEEAMVVMEKDQSYTIFLTENYEADFLRSIKEKMPSVHLFLIANSSLKPADLMAMHKIGITAVINHSENPATLADEIVKCIISSNIKTSEKRFHIRVQPKEFEDVRAAIFIKNLGKFVRGKIIDISAGGLAVRLTDSLEASLLTPKTVYDPVLISIAGGEVKTLSSLIAKRNDGAGFKFENVEAKDMKKIAAYIHNKISESSKNLMSQVVS